ncbi:MAG: hypothetical protein JWP81_4360 [Ferruginibacter sp.]|nr:hypothetical protein [Ferruginibacter sp.]
MEVVSKNAVPVSIESAAMLEKEGEFARAVAMYEKLVKKFPSNLAVLDRLMILSRKLKEYKKELTYIDTAIKIHEQKYSSLKSKDVKVVQLSKRLNALLGHTDKKGKNLLAIPEVERLKKRKAVVLKKIK